MKKRILHVSLLLATAFALGGCALTRVSEKHHAKEAEELQAVGFTLEQARAAAMQKGYTCEQEPDRNRSVQKDGVVRKTDILQCNKSSAELICPQRRYVVFNLDPATGKVYAVGARINQQSCF